MAKFDWKPYVPSAARRVRAARESASLRRQGRAPTPVVVHGRTIVTTFWGKAWCANLERYSDYANRLPRGRAYLRSGAVVDLEVTPGEIAAVVSGSALYRVRIRIAAVSPARWRAICADCAGAIDSLIALLQGSLSVAVATRLCSERTGLFPAPHEMRFDCSCPDWASMCKHVAAVLYGVGVRLDEQPALLFALRGVDQQELVSAGGQELGLRAARLPAGRLLEDADLSALFGIEIADGDDPPRRS